MPTEIPASQANSHRAAAFCPCNYTLGDHKTSVYEGRKRLLAAVQEDPAPDAVLTVQDHEVEADRWVSPQQLKKQQAEQAEAAARSSGFQQAVALRGVRHILGDQGNLQEASQACTPVLLPTRLISCYPYSGTGRRWPGQTSGTQPPP